MEHKPVIIAGAGPVGLFIAIRLAQAGISVLILESHQELLHTTRAVLYQPIIIKGLESLGLLDVFLSNAVKNPTPLAWREKSGKLLGELPMIDDEYMVAIGQWRMNRLLLEKLGKYSCAEVRYGHPVVGIDQDESNGRAKVMVHRRAEGDDTMFSADWVVAADGANSTVRRSLAIPFEGYTYQGFKMIGVDVLYDFTAENDWTLCNFIVDAEDWAVVVFTGEDEAGEPFGNGRPLWRVAYSEPDNWDASREAVMKRAQERVKHYLKGRQEFEVPRAEPYVLQQRLAQQARKGRVVLAGDALHSNNPMGGLGLTNGILDAFAYGNALVRVISDGEPDSLMSECAESRRQGWKNKTGPTTEANLDRVRTFEPEVEKARATYFEKLNTDPNYPREVRVGMNDMLKNDFRRPTATV